MNISRYRFLLWNSSIAIALFSGSVASQGLGQLKDLVGGDLGGAASSLGSLSSIASASPGNAAGIIEFCVKNNYLSGGDASSIKDQLLGKLPDSPGQPPESNPDYVSGAMGVLNGSDGQKIDLNMAGLKAKATKKVCKKILEQAKSFL